MVRDVVEKKKKRIECKIDVNEREKKRIGVNEVVLREKVVFCVEYMFVVVMDVIYILDFKNFGKKEFC